MAKICRHHHHSFEEKKLVLEKFLTSDKYKNMNPKDFSIICGVSYQSLLRWGTKIDWDLNRIDELKRKKQKKEEGTSKLSDAVKGKILKLKKDHPNWGPLKIKHHLWRHEQLLIPQSSIYQFLKEKGLVQKREEGAKTDQNRSFEYSYPLAAVQMDLMQIVLTGGQVLHLVTLLDDFSRFVLEVQFIAVRTMDEVIRVFREAVRQYGIMEKLLTDCGSEFVSWQRFTRFEELLVALDVEYIASGPNKKESQGKVERWHQTVREELRLHGPLIFGSEAQLWIREVGDMYNYERPHQGIGGLLPADRFFGINEQIEAELDRCRKEGSRRIYFVCRVGDRKLVVSGRNSESAGLYLDGKSVSLPRTYNNQQRDPND
jgi:transposase InsO family protein